MRIFPLGLNSATRQNPERQSKTTSSRGGRGAGRGGRSCLV